MSNDDYIPSAEAARVIWFNDFISVATANMTTLGLTAADITNLSGEITTYTTDVTVCTAARNTFHGTTKTKATAEKIAVAATRAIVRRIQSNAGVSIALKEQLQINPRSNPRTNEPPVTPANLVATPDANGTNTLTWDTTGNKTGTKYIIEAMTGSATTFAYVDVTNSKRFVHTGQTPGVPVAYRVTASRAKMKSIPSNTAIVYMHPPMLTLSKAA